MNVVLVTINKWKWVEVADPLVQLIFWFYNTKRIFKIYLLADFNVSIITPARTSGKLTCLNIIISCVWEFAKYIHMETFHNCVNK